MRRVCRLIALLVAFSLCAQITAVGLCETVCAMRGWPNGAPSSPSEQGAQGGSDCHPVSSTENGYGLSSAGVGCEHSPGSDTLQADRVSTSKQSVALADLTHSTGTITPLRTPATVLQRPHHPPGAAVRSAGPLRL